MSGSCETVSRGVLVASSVLLLCFAWSQDASGTTGANQSGTVFHVSASGAGCQAPPCSGADEVFLFDSHGVLTGQYDQLPALGCGPFGYRDGATDEQGFVVRSP